MKGERAWKASRDRTAWERAQVLAAVERGPRTSTDLRDDLAARIGTMDRVTDTITGCRRLGLVTTAPIPGKLGYTVAITDAGRDELAARKAAA